jgi:hypothetical protein
VPDVSIVVVSWNTRDALARCLASVDAATSGLAVETVVVDNASADGSAAMVRARFPHVRLLVNDANVGFGRACNQGVAAGRGRTVLLLNSDCELGPGALAVLAAALDADAALGAVFPRLVNPDGTLQPSVHARLPSPWSYLPDVLFGGSLRHALYRAAALKPWLLRAQLRRHARAHDVAWGGAACVLVRRAAFEAVGGFDPRFFMYMEDVDLCARLARAGYRLRYRPEATVRHHWGVSAAKDPAAMIRHAYASRIAYFAKHHPGWRAALARRLALAELGVRVLAFSALGRLTGRASLGARAASSAACRVALSAAPAREAQDVR